MLGFGVSKEDGHIEVEVEVWGLKRLKGLGATEIPEDSTMGVGVNHKNIMPNKAQDHAQPDRADLQKV